MNEAFESLVRRMANRFGLDITRHRPAASPAGRLASMLASHRVDVVLDAGANIGQFALGLRRAGYAGRIVSFEPLPDAWRQLNDAARRDPRWDVPPAVALGATDGQVEINVAGNSVSSSILEMLHSHASAAPASRYVARERVPLRRLDSLAPGLVAPDAAPFLKIDTQGYETQVLDGASQLLERAAGLQLELSLVPLYAGQALYRELMDRLDAAGFDLWALWPGFTDPDNGRMLQVDAVFFRRPGDRR